MVLPREAYPASRYDPSPLVDLSRKAERERLSASAIKAFLALAHRWRLRDEDDITVVIVEHNMGLIAALTDRVVVLDHGRKLMEGTAAEAQSDPRVIEAYIGKDAADAA